MTTTATQPKGNTMTRTEAITAMRATKARIDALATAPACIELECELDALWADYDRFAEAVQAADLARLAARV